MEKDLEIINDQTIEIIMKSSKEKLKNISAKKWKDIILYFENKVSIFFILKYIDFKKINNDSNVLLELLLKVKNPFILKRLKPKKLNSLSTAILLIKHPFYVGMVKLEKINKEDWDFLFEEIKDERYINYLKRIHKFLNINY